MCCRRWSGSNNQQQQQQLQLIQYQDPFSFQRPLQRARQGFSALPEYLAANSTSPDRAPGQFLPSIPACTTKSARPPCLPSCLGRQTRSISSILPFFLSFFLPSFSFPSSTGSSSSSYAISWFRVEPRHTNYSLDCVKTDRLTDLRNYYGQRSQHPNLILPLRLGLDPGPFLLGCVGLRLDLPASSSNQSSLVCSENISRQIA